MSALDSAQFVVHGTTMDDLRRRAADVLCALGGEWEWSLTVTPHTWNVSGHVALWQAEVDAYQRTEGAT